jgi:hypothetical protein
MRRVIMMIAAVTVSGSIAGVALAQSNPPPPAGGFNTSVCYGRGAHPPKNGRLIGQYRKKLALYSVRADGSGSRRVTHPPRFFGDYYPAPSSDGKSVAFLRLYQPNVDARPIRLMVVNLRTHKTRVLRSHLTEEYAPAWSPDGRWITAGVDVHTTDTPQMRVTRETMLIHPDGSGLHPLDGGGYLLLDGSWSPNGRCFAALARYQDRSPTSAYTGDAGLAVLAASGGRPNTFYPRTPRCPSSGWAGCASSVPRLGQNAPNYVNWTNDGRGLLTLRGLFRTPPPSRSTSPDRIDVTRSGLSESVPGKVLVTKANLPHRSPDGRFIVAFSYARDKTYAVFRRDGKLVNRLDRKFYPAAWAPAPR